MESLTKPNELLTPTTQENLGNIKEWVNFSSEADIFTGNIFNAFSRLAEIAGDLSALVGFFA